MRNWYALTSEENREDDAGIIWQLNQLINFGLTDRKLNKKLLTKYWDRLTLDPKRKKFLQFILWQKPY